MSGDQDEKSILTFPNAVAVSAGQSVKIAYQYNVGYGCDDTVNQAPVFEVYIGDMKIGSTQGPFTGYPHDACNGVGGASVFSPERVMIAPVPFDTSGTLQLRFTNNGRNIYIRVTTVELLGTGAEGNVSQ